MARLLKAVLKYIAWLGCSLHVLESNGNGPFCIYLEKMHFVIKARKEAINSILQYNNNNNNTN